MGTAPREPVRELSPQMADFFRKGSSSLKHSMSQGGVLPGQQSQHPVAGPAGPLAGEAHPQAWLSLGIAYSEEGWSPWLTT